MNKRHRGLIKMLADDMNAPNEVVEEAESAFREAEAMALWLQSYVVPLVMQQAMTSEQAKEDMRKLVYCIDATDMYASLRFGIETAKMVAEQGGGK